MKTTQIMKREFFDVLISQRTNDSYFNATELLEFYNKSRIEGSKKKLSNFWRSSNISAFAEELALDLNIDRIKGSKIFLGTDMYTTTRGTKGVTYMHPYLFVKFAMWLSTEFEVKVIKWIYDNLIDFRNQAGDNYKEMSATIRDTYADYYKKNPSPLIYRQEARYLNELVKGSHKSGKRNELSEKELSLLNGLQKLNISLLHRTTPVDVRKSKLRDYAEMYKIANF